MYLVTAYKKLLIYHSAIIMEHSECIQIKCTRQKFKIKI